MKKIFKNIFVFLFLLCSRLVFTNNLDYYSQIINQRISVMNGIGNIYSKGKGMVVFSDVISADEFLRQIAKYQTNNKISELNLFFPDVDYVDEYIEEVSKKVENIRIYLLDSQNDDKYMQNRDFIIYKIKNIDKKIEKLTNVIVIKINVSKLDVPEIFIDSLTKNVLDSSYYNKYIKNIGEIK